MGMLQVKPQDYLEDYVPFLMTKEESPERPEEVNANVKVSTDPGPAS